MPVHVFPLVPALVDFAYARRGLLLALVYVVCSCSSVPPAYHAGNSDKAVSVEPGDFVPPASIEQDVPPDAIEHVSPPSDMEPAASPVESVISEPAEVSSDTSEPIKILFGGDVTLTWGYHELVPDPYGDLKWPFRRLQDLFSAMDVVMVNCENAITKRGKAVVKQFNFRMDPALTAVFSEGGVDIVTIANNHVFDFGPEGLMDTIDALDRAGVLYVGAGMDLDEARKPVVMEIKGKKVAFLAYGNYSPAGRNRPGVAYRYPDHISSDIRKVKSDGADIVVVNFHWGIELAPKPQRSDRKLAYLAIDSGADAVIGHHPHVVQPIEIYKGKVIAYSLGNFVFGGNSKKPKDSILLQVSFSPDGDVTHQVHDIRIHPEETRYQPYLITSQPTDRPKVVRK